MKSIIISSLLSLILSGSPVVFTSQNPGNIIQTPYGTATRTYYFNSEEGSTLTIGNISIPQVNPVSSLTYTFSGLATGTFDILVAPDLTNYQLFTSNCTLLSITQDGYFRFRVYNVRECQISFATPGILQQVMYQFANQNITISDTLDANVEDIMSYTQAIDGNVQTINANTNTIRNILLQSLGGYVSNDGSLYTDMQHIKKAFMFNNVPVGSYSAYSLFGFLGDLNRTDTDAMPYYIISDTAPQYMLYLTAGVDYYLSVIVENPNYYGMSSFIQVVDDQDSSAPSSMHYIDYNNLRSTYTMKITPSRTASYRIKFTDAFNGYIYGKKIIPLYFGTLTDIDNDIAMLTHLPYQTNSLLKEAINAIKNMAVNVTNLTVNATGITYNTTQQNVDNSVNTYNNNINIVNNVENNFKDMFDNYNQNFNTQGIPITNDMVKTSTFMNNVVTELYGIDIIKYPVTLLLLGIVIIGILG